MASITIIVGSGVPGHATIQINHGEMTTYLGLGPGKPNFPYLTGSSYATGHYDVVTLPKGVSPVAAVRTPSAKVGEYHYVDATHYNVKSFTHQIADAQADAAIAAATKYRIKNPEYNGFLTLVCTDYALSILQAAIPESNTSDLSRIPSVLQGQLADMVKNKGLMIWSGGSTPIVRDFGFKGLQQDERPPNLKPQQQFNDNIPFNFASGEVGMSGQPRESKTQVSLTRAGDGSANLSVGDSTVVNFEPGQLASVANSDGKLRLSFSKDESRDKFFGNVMAVDTGTGDVSVLDKHGKLSDLEPGSRINVTSAGWDHAGGVKPNGLERTAAGFG